MSYDPNGQNTRQDILEEIERVRQYKETQKLLSARKTQARPLKRRNRDDRQ